MLRSYWPPRRLRKPQPRAVERDAVERCAPGFAGPDRHGARQRPGGDDLAGRKRRMDPVVRQQPDKMTERGERAVENVRGIAPVDVPAVARADLGARSRAVCGDLPLSVIGNI